MPFLTNLVPLYYVSFWCHFNLSKCLLDCLAPYLLFQTTNNIPTRFSSYHHQSYQSIINQLPLPYYLLDAFSSHWDFCSLPHLMQDLDSHQSPSSLSTVITHLNLSKTHTIFIVSWNALFTLRMSPLLSKILVLCMALLHSSLTFFDYVKCNIPICNISKVNEVITIGTTKHKFLDTKGRFIYLPQVAYHLSSSKVDLFSPQ